eukprot:3258043-Rhodomonas_salina.1
MSISSRLTILCSPSARLSAPRLAASPGIPESGAEGGSPKGPSSKRRCCRLEARAGFRRWTSSRRCPCRSSRTMVTTRKVRSWHVGVMCSTVVTFRAGRAGDSWLEHPDPWNPA